MKKLKFFFPFPIIKQDGERGQFDIQVPSNPFSFMFTKKLENLHGFPTFFLVFRMVLTNLLICIMIYADNKMGYCHGDDKSRFIEGTYII